MTITPLPIHIFRMVKRALNVIQYRPKQGLICDQNSFPEKIKWNSGGTFLRRKQAFYDSNLTSVKDHKKSHKIPPCLDYCCRLCGRIKP